MAVSKKFQPVPKDAGKVLIGVAQIRVSPASVRAVGGGSIKAIRQVPDSTTTTVTGVDGSTTVTLLVPSPTSTLTAVGTSTLACSGVYTSADCKYDGAFLIRVKTLTADAGATVSIFGPNGYLEDDVAVPMTNKNLKLSGSISSGVLVSGNVTVGAVVGQTYIIPVYSNLARDAIQTGIVCPYSLFSEDNESVGALKDSKFSPKIDDQKQFTAGFPEETYNTIVTRTSIGVSFDASEFSNTNIDHLRSLMKESINNSKIGAVATEIVMASADGTLYTYFVPSAQLTSFPELGAGQDFGSQKWALNAVRQTQITGESTIYNTWLSNVAMYTEGDDWEH